MKTDTTDWIEKVRQMALELHAIQAAQEDTRKRERDAFSKLTTAQMFFERPPSYNEMKDELNRLAGESMRLEARMVKAVLEGVKPRMDKKNDLDLETGENAMNVKGKRGNKLGTR